MYEGDTAVSVKYIVISVKDKLYEILLIHNVYGILINTDLPAYAPVFNVLL